MKLGGLSAAGLVLDAPGVEHSAIYLPPREVDTGVRPRFVPGVNNSASHAEMVIRQAQLRCPLLGIAMSSPNG